MRQRKGQTATKADFNGGDLKKSNSSSWKETFTFVRPSNDVHFNFICSVAVGIMITCLIAENISPTAYGRFGSDTSFSVSPRLGWWLMEAPVTFVFVYFYFIKGGSQSSKLVPCIMALVLCGHYSYRGWYYPYNIKVSGNSSNFSLLPAVGGWLVTITHGYLNAKWFAEHGKNLNEKWLKSSRFWIGLIVYYSGFFMLVWHDNLMRNLRNTPGPRYRIPVGGMFDYATCAHYFAELWAWLGPNGAFIFTVSLVNLVPRAVTTHAWYLEKFGEEYPAERKYLVPFVW